MRARHTFLGPVLRDRQHRTAEAERLLPDLDEVVNFPATSSFHPRPVSSFMAVACGSRMRRALLIHRVLSMQGLSEVLAWKGVVGRMVVALIEKNEDRAWMILLDAAG